jgi:hypothetical protein
MPALLICPDQIAVPDQTSTASFSFHFACRAKMEGYGGRGRAEMPFVPERSLRAAGAHDQAHGDARDHALRVRAPVLTPAGFALSNPHFSNLLQQLFSSRRV